MQYPRSVVDADDGGGGQGKKVSESKKRRDRQNSIIEFCLSFFLFLVVSHENRKFAQRTGEKLRSGGEAFSPLASKAPTHPPPPQQ